MDSNHRPLGYEPNELATALPRFILYCCGRERIRTSKAFTPDSFQDYLTTTVHSSLLLCKYTKLNSYILILFNFFSFWNDLLVYDNHIDNKYNVCLI